MNTPNIWTERRMIPRTSYIAIPALPRDPPVDLLCPPLGDRPLHPRPLPQHLQRKRGNVAL